MTMTLRKRVNWWRGKAKWKLVALQNWWQGYEFDPVRRCRICGHTTYERGHCNGG